MNVDCAVRLLCDHFVCKCLLVYQDIFCIDAELLQIIFGIFSAFIFQFLNIFFLDVGAGNYNCLNFHIGPFLCLNDTIRYG